MFDLDDGKKRDLRRDYAHGSLTLLWLCAHTVCVSVRLCVCVCVCARARACAHVRALVSTQSLLPFLLEML